MHTGPMPARILWAWLDAGHSVAGVWTSSGISRATWRKDRHLGWLAPKFSLAAAIKRWRLPSRTIGATSDPAFRDMLAASNADVIVSAFFPYILPRAVLERLQVPVVNIHPALLPAYRGPHPLATMLLDETADEHGGVTLHRLVPKVDAGPIYAAVPVPLPADGNPRRWEIHLARAAARLTVEALPKIVAGALPEQPQDEARASYRRASAADFVVTPAITGARLDRLLKTAGWLSPIAVKVGAHTCDVSRVRRRLGEVSGAPPRVGLTSIDIDLADGRYRLSRQPVWHGRRQRWATFFLRVRERA
jgi:methionyl-tRNA formyltransferase